MPLAGGRFPKNNSSDPGMALSLAGALSRQPTTIREFSYLMQPSPVLSARSRFVTPFRASKDALAERILDRVVALRADPRKRGRRTQDRP